MASQASRKRKSDRARARQKVLHAKGKASREAWQAQQAKLSVARKAPALPVERHEPFGASLLGVMLLGSAALVLAGAILNPEFGEWDDA